MVFMGSEQFPVENAYDAYLSENGGNSNAYTEAELTCFHFDVQPAALRGALERFASQFVSPLCLESATDREASRSLPLTSPRLAVSEGRPWTPLCSLECAPAARLTLRPHGPLCCRSLCRRQVCAVESEFEQVLQSDQVRLLQVQCATAAEGHPYRLFSWGNKKSLVEDVEKAAGEPLRGLLLKARPLPVPTPVPLHTFRNQRPRARQPLRSGSGSIFL